MKIVVNNKIVGRNEYPFVTTISTPDHLAVHRFLDTHSQRLFVEGIQALAAVTGAEVELTGDHIKSREEREREARRKRRKKS